MNMERQNRGIVIGAPVTSSQRRRCIAVNCKQIFFDDNPAGKKAIFSSSFIAIQHRSA
jgi:hypothetical protein